MQHEQRGAWGLKLTVDKNMQVLAMRPQHCHGHLRERWSVDESLSFCPARRSVLGSQQVDRILMQMEGSDDRLVQIRCVGPV